MKFEFTAGCLVCGPIRDFIKRCQFNGLKIEFYEGSGFWEKTFIIKGDDKDVANVRHSLYEWANEHDLLG
jgi:hypothetical protein